MCPKCNHINLKLAVYSDYYIAIKNRNNNTFKISRLKKNIYITYI